MDTVSQAIPFTAWEQAAIIGIFIVFVGILLTWFSKQADKWQKFMFDIDEKWRQLNKEQRDTNLEAMNCVEGSLKDLTTVTQELVSEVREMRDDSKAFYESFHAHDIQAKEILAQVQKPAPKPRSTKSTTQQENK